VPLRRLSASHRMLYFYFNPFWKQTSSPHHQRIQWNSQTPQRTLIKKTDMAAKRCGVMSCPVFSQCSAKVSNVEQLLQQYTGLSAASVF
jgi:hypothetical protein